MSADNTTRKGKIARLPRLIREELNERLSDGQSGPVILAWLNALPEVKGVLEKHFNAELISEQNLSAWRQGGYVDWCDNQSKADRLKELAEMSMKMVQATGLKLTDGASAIAAGNILAELEASDDPEYRDVLIKQIATLRSGDHAVHEGARKDRKLDLDVKKTQLKAREVALSEDKFQRTLCEKLLDVATSPEVQKIVVSDKPKAVKLEQLRLHIFGEDEPDEGAAFLAQKGAL
jgi:hypothetical protein